MSTSAKPLIPLEHHLIFGRNSARPDVTREMHVWHLELLLEGILEITRSGSLSGADRRAVDGVLVAARLASERLLSDHYPLEKIALGYRAAHGVVALATTAADDQRQMDPTGARKIALTCFRADIGNMRRWNTLAERAPGVALDALLPPLPERSPDEQCRILPFPYSEF